MHVDAIIDNLCKIKGVERDTLFGYKHHPPKDVYYTRYMFYTILKDIYGVSSYRLAKIFHRDRRNIVRGITAFRRDCVTYPKIRTEYEELIRQIEVAK